MRVEVIPAVNCTERQCVQERLTVARGFSKWVHLDVADGSFTYNKTWGNPRAWRSFQSPLVLEVHLMVRKPLDMIDAWLRVGAKRVIVHVETVNNDELESLIEKADGYGAAIMLSSNPETSVKEYVPHMRAISAFQVLAVHPGLAGQPFLPSTIGKVRFLRSEARDAIIEIDGGVNLEIGKRATEAGANVLVSASYVFSSSNPRQAYTKLAALK